MPPRPATMESDFGDDKPMTLSVNKSVVSTPLPRSESTTWSFVQMNMTLLPIACPLPVSGSHRIQRRAVKPLTPTQKQHRRLRQHTTNMSPRRHDLGCSNGRSTDTIASYQSSLRLPPTCGTKRTFSEIRHVPASLPSAVSVSMKMRSFSEDLYTPAPRGDSGYSSDPAAHPMSLHQSASLSLGCAGKGLYKGKRILELQDEDRRFHPDDRGTAPSLSKRSKH